VTAGSDSHRIETFGFALGDAYALLERAGFEDLAFRRGGERVTVPIGRGRDGDVAPAPTGSVDAPVRACS
jgi:hypothetical protein